MKRKDDRRAGAALERPAPARDRWWSGPAITVGALALLLGVPELVTRIVDPPLRQYRTIYFGRDPRSPELFMTDPALLWRLRPNVDLTFLDRHVSTDRSGFRKSGMDRVGPTVLVLGDSTPFGWLVDDEEAFPARLASLLNRDAPSPGWRVVNAAVPGYTSFQVRQIADELLDALQPRVLVLCVGNNEAAPGAASDRRVFEKRRWIAAFESVLSASHFALWLQEHFAAAPRPFEPSRWDGETRRVSLTEVEENLRAVIAAAKARGIRVIVLTPPVNLFAPPSGISVLPEARAIEDWCRSIIAQINAGDVTNALAQVDGRLASDPRAFYARWLRGLALAQAGDLAGAEREIERAFEEDPFSDRAPLSYRLAMARLAASESLPLIDTNALLRGAAESPLDQKFADHCHPDATGHQAIAAAIAPLIVDR